MKNKFGQFKKGHVSWNKNKSGYSTSKKGKKYPQYSGINAPHWKGGKITFKCPTCKKQFLNYSSNHRKYCSHKCYSLSLNGKLVWNKGKKCPQFSGKNSGSWKGGKYQTYNRWFIYCPNHPLANKKYILRSHLIAEKCLGRYLKKLEVIHHINNIKDDDRPENLYLFSSLKEHNIFHLHKFKPNLVSNLL